MFTQKPGFVGRANNGLRLRAAFLFLVWLASTLCSPAITIIVTNQAINGPGTLRALLPTAHNGDVITFAVTGVITNVITGGLTISNNISIVGPGAGALTITGTNHFTAFQVSTGATASISGLTFYRCIGGINSSGNLTVSNCLFTGCYVGGGINNSSNLALVGCTFNDCRGAYGASTYPEAVPGSSGTSGANGGAIVNSGNLWGLNCQFQNNTAGWGGDGTPGVVQSFYRGTYRATSGGNGGNGGNGGAVYNSGTVSFTNCTFGWNTSGQGGSGGAGGSGANTSQLPPFLYPGPGWPGGNAGNAGNGSAVYSSGSATFVSCTFYGNTTGASGNGGNGGDAFNPNNNSYDPGGSGGSGGNAGSGTLYCTSPCQIVACTFFNNTASSGGSGGSGGAGASAPGIGGPGGSGGNAGNGGSGGAIYGPRTGGTNFFLQNVLVAGDTCGYAGSAGSAGANGGGTLNGPSPTNGLSAMDGTGPDLSGVFTSHGHNLVGLGDGSTGFTNGVHNDIVGSGTPIDAMVNGLADNGGPVYTCSLQAGSPALEAGDDSLLGNPWYLTTDARGYARKSGSHVDIGAYELAQLSTPVMANVTVTPDGALLSVTNTPGVTFEVLGTTDPTLPVGNWDDLGPMTEISPGVFQWTDVSYSDYDSRFFLVRSP